MNRNDAFIIIAIIAVLLITLFIFGAFGQGVVSRRIHRLNIDTGASCPNGVCEAGETCGNCPDCNCPLGQYCNTTDWENGVRPSCKPSSYCGNDILDVGEECEYDSNCGADQLCAPPGHEWECLCVCDCNCYDSDGGIDYYQKGTAISDYAFEGPCDDYIQEEFTDYCLDGDWLNEYKCVNRVLVSRYISIAHFEDYQCPNGCFNGRCSS